MGKVESTPELDAQVLRSAEIVWNYLRLEQAPRESDVMLVACSHDLRVADHAAKLFRDGWAPLVLFSGGIAHQDDLLNTGWNRPEADVFADRFIASGLPDSVVLRERKAQNTGENIRFSGEILKRSGVEVNKVLIVQKPYMERRVWATARAQCPEWDITVSSMAIDFCEYPDPDHGIFLDDVIHIMIGDLQRIRDYPALGYQVAQDIPELVIGAWQYLVNRGFVRHLSV